MQSELSLRGLKKRHLWVGGALSAVALVLAFWRADLGKVSAAFAGADYLLVAAAAGLQLVVIAVIAWRWGLFFRSRPRLPGLLSAVLIAQLANSISPLRLGILVRAYLLGRSEGQSKVLVLTTVVGEKVFDVLALVLLFVTFFPFVMPDSVQWESLGLSKTVFIALLPVLVLLTYQRRRALVLARYLLRRFPWAERFGLVQKFEAGLEGLAQLQGIRSTALLWGWTLVIAGLGVGVNYLVLRAFDIQVQPVAAVVLLVALQIGPKVLPGVPLGGTGLFQLICIGALALFSVEDSLALSYGFMLQAVVLVPGSILGALALYHEHYSWRQLRAEVEE